MNGSTTAACWSIGGASERTNAHQNGKTSQRTTNAVTSQTMARRSMAGPPDSNQTQGGGPAAAGAPAAGYAAAETRLAVVCYDAAVALVAPPPALPRSRPRG